MRGRLTAMIVGAFSLVAFAVAPTTASGSESLASVSQPSVTPTKVSAAPEYFSDTWADPLDFSNGSDFDTSGRRSPGVNTSLSGGVLNYTQVQGAGRIYFADAAPNELPVLQHREATYRPIDSTRMTRLAVRAFTDRNVVGVIYWDHCAGSSSSPACPGFKTFDLRAGWHTYDLDMTGKNDSDSHTEPAHPNSVWGAPWTAGGIVRLGWQPSYTGVTGIKGTIDNVRVYQPGRSLITVGNPGGTANLWHDGDANQANNGSASNQAKHAGVLRTNFGGGSRKVDVGALAPGTYRFELESGGSFSSPSSAVVVDAAPAPVVLDPDVAGSGDWFEATRGRKLDFSSPVDVFTLFDGQPNVRNANPGVFGGQLHATSAGRFDDPQVYLTDALWNGPVLDAQEWHRITWRIQFDGGWGTNAVPGQGLDTKFCWFVANGPAACSKDVFPQLGPQTYSVDLKTANPADVESPGGPGVGFGGAASRWLHLFRLDPHEDPAPRTWHLDDVRIAHDDRIPFGGSFPIRFVDRAQQSGSIAEVFVDRDPWFSNGAARIANVGVHSGVNVVNWSASGHPPGSYWVHVRITDPNGARRTQTSTGPVDVPDPVKWSPFGGLDVVVPFGRGIAVAGWTIDPDWVRDPTHAHVYIDGVGYDLVANQPHTGIGQLRSDAGPWHGYYLIVPAEPGPHTVCAYAINFGYGNHTGLGCRGVFVK